MSLEQTLMTDMKAALKAGDKLALSTIRGLLADVKNARIDKRADVFVEAWQPGFHALHLPHQDGNELPFLQRTLKPGWQLDLDGVLPDMGVWVPDHQIGLPQIGHRRGIHRHVPEGGLVGIDICDG